jgi:hypothetical protein
MTDTSVMISYIPRLPFQLDPLIAEAKRRARRRRFALAVLVVVGASAGLLAGWELVGTGANATAATANSGNQCAGPSPYGTQCIDVTGSGRQVSAIKTSYDDTALLWPNTKWRVDLERYVCDPIGKAKSACSAATTWHGRSRVGVRVVDHQAYPPAHLDQSPTHRYWPGFSLPHTFRSNVWLCTEMAFYNAATHQWVYNAAGLPHGLRACTSIHN